MKLNEAFTRFMQYDFETAVINATEAYLLNGNKYTVELFYHGSNRIILNKDIPVWHSKYSIFLNIPIFNSEEYENKCFDRVRKQMINSFYNLNNIFI